jgi:hypothetical protein
MLGRNEDGDGWLLSWMEANVADYIDGSANYPLENCDIL